jgi:hypothetical protein
LATVVFSFLIGSGAVALGDTALHYILCDEPCLTADKVGFQGWNPSLWRRCSLELFKVWRQLGGAVGVLFMVFPRVTDKDCGKVGDAP